MANQYNNKVVLSNGTTVIDLSTDTVTDASHIMSGHRGHLADGSVVNGTGASESQVVSIEDVPNTTGTTAKITGVAAPEGSISITTNGSHNVYAYETAVVSVPGNTFEFVYSALGSSFTFNSSYADIKAAAQAGKVFDFYYLDTGEDELPIAGGDVQYVTNYIFDDDETSTTFSEAVLMTLQSYGEEMGSPELYEVCYGYSSSTLVCKSRRIAFQPMTAPLTVTQNGTYTPPYDDAFYSSVTVNVSGGGSATIQPLTVTSNGTYTAPSGVDGYSPVTVNVQGAGGGGDPNADVIFIDYDGTVLYSYSASEFANLTEMPANPTHTGLVAQGWNWSLDVAKGQIAAEPAAGLVIGQMYTTDDGKTRIYVYLPSNCTTPHLGLAPNGTVAIDWGDNSATTQLTGTSVSTLVTAQHEYASSGSYVITIEPISGTFAILGAATAANNSTSLLMKGAANAPYVDQRYANTIMRVEIGNSCRLGERAFWMCRCLRSVTIPSSVTSFGTYIFNNCTSLISVTIPTAVASTQNFSFSGCSALTYIANSASASVTPSQGSFQSCYSLKRTSWRYNGQGPIRSSTFSNCQSLVRANVSGMATSIASNAFAGCYSLSTAITIPTTVTEIASAAFSNCYGMREYHFLSTTPPTLGSTTVFNNIQSDCKIYVPQGSLNAYQTANNWSTYASYIVEEA